MEQGIWAGFFFNEFWDDGFNFWKEMEGFCAYSYHFVTFLDGLEME